MLDYRHDARMPTDHAAGDPASDDDRHVVRFRVDAHTAAELATVIGAIESLIGAGAWLELCTPACHDPVLARAYEHMRHASFGNPNDVEPLLWLASAALFDRPPEYAERRRWHRRHRETFWASADDTYGAWLRRELDAEAPDAHDRLFGWAHLRRIEQRSPVLVDLGIAATPVASVAFLALLKGMIKLWKDVSAAREEHARARAVTAWSHAEEAREELRESLYRAALDQTPEAAKELAIRQALGASIDIMSAPSIRSISVTEATDDPLADIV
jgi:hypothetical protein